MPQVIKKPPGCLAGGGCLVMAGLVMAGFFGLALFGTAVPKAEAEPTPLGVWVTVIVLTLAGLFVAFLGFRKWRTVKRQRRIIDIIVHQRHKSVPNIADLVGIADPKAAMSEIQTVLDKGYLPGYHLDPQTCHLKWFDPNGTPEPPKPRWISFKCEACGASNEIETMGGGVYCQFCGTPYVKKTS
jgi:hypothetical protein